MAPNYIDVIAKKRICNHCVRETFLSRVIAHYGTKSRCSYCKGDEWKTWSIHDLADRVELAFANHFGKTPTEPSQWEQHLMADRESDFWWYREGEPVLDAIQAAAEIPKDAAADVGVILNDRHHIADPEALGDESEFAPDSHYEPRAPGAGGWHREWHSFERSLKFEARFFSRAAAKHLAAIFKGVQALRTKDGRPLIVNAGPNGKIDHLYRARVFQSESKLKEAVCYPDRELGSPPSDFASAGRMNARGIAVFYGATDPDTAVAEVRPPVGSKVAVGRFSIIRSLQLLDLTVLEDACDEGSVFDPTLRERLERVAFLKTLGERMTRPVMPEDEAFDYLPTQAIADFLATENTPPLDGIIFNSAQSKTGLNVVLFRKASTTARIDLPFGTDIQSSTYTSSDEGVEIDYSVRVSVPPGNPSNKTGPSKVKVPPFHWATAKDDMPEISLVVDPGSIVVHHVDSVGYSCTKYLVTRMQVEKSDSKF